MRSIIESGMVKGTLVLFLGHETDRKHRRIGRTSTHCRATLARRQRNTRGCKDRACLPFFGKALERRFGRIGMGRARCEAPSRSHAATDGRTEATTREALGTWAIGGRLSNGAMDVRSCRARDSAALWRNVPCRPRASHLVRARLDVSETGATCQRTRREHDSPLAQARLAADKKRGVVGKLASFFSTKVALCCSPFAVARGLLAERRRSSTLGTGATDCRPWWRCRCLPVVSTSAFITTCNVAISMGQTRQSSCEASMMDFSTR